MSEITLFHGSEKEIEVPVYGYGRSDNDFGRGFYCTESESLSREWACQSNKPGVSNRYVLETDSLEILDIQKDGYSVMNWIAVLMRYRRIEPNRYNADEIMEKVGRKFFVDVERYDIVRGYRADDSYFLIANMFVDGQITYRQLCTALRLGDFGEQIVLKSKKAFKNIRFVSSEYLEPQEHYKTFKEREFKANNDFAALIKNRTMSDELDINDIIEVDEDDPRLF